VKLDNGFSLWMAPVSGFPKIAFTFAARGGYAADPKELPGIAELLASTITQGTSQRSARQIAEELQACGGDLESRPRTDYLLLQTSVLSEKAEPALNLLADLIRNASFPDQEVEIAKRKAAATLEAQEAEAHFVARRALYRTLFGDHPYAIISATGQSIAKTTPADLKREYARRFRPSQSVLIVVGAFDPKAVEVSVRKNFESWTNPSSPSIPDVPALTPSRSNTVFYVPRANSVQTTFFIGAFAPTRTQSDYEAADLANTIYGGMFGSRLILNIREDKGYTYSPRAFVTPNKQAGVLITQADVRNAVTGPSFNEIAYELNRVATTAPEPGEVERAKRYSIGSLAVFLQPQASLGGVLADYWADSLTPKDLAAEGEKILNVSAEQIQEAGRKYFPMSHMTVIAVGDENALKTQLAPFGLELKRVQ
jgi:predicted Zn-dependent peptidase